MERKDSIVCFAVHCCLHCNAWLSSPLKNKALFTMKSLLPVGSCCSFRLIPNRHPGMCVMKLQRVVGLIHLLSKNLELVIRKKKITAFLQLSSWNRSWKRCWIIDVWSICSNSDSKTAFSANENLLKLHLFLIGSVTVQWSQSISVPVLVQHLNEAVLVIWYSCTLFKVCLDINMHRYWSFLV